MQKIRQGYAEVLLVFLFLFVSAGYFLMVCTQTGAYYGNIDGNLTAFTAGLRHGFAGVADGALSSVTSSEANVFSHIDEWHEGFLPLLAVPFLAAALLYLYAFVLILLKQREGLAIGSAFALLCGGAAAVIFMAQLFLKITGGQYTSLLGRSQVTALIFIAVQGLLFYRLRRLKTAGFYSRVNMLGRYRLMVRVLVLFVLFHFVFIGAATAAFIPAMRFLRSFFGAFSMVIESKAFFDGFNVVIPLVIIAGLLLLTGLLFLLKEQKSGLSLSYAGFFLLALAALVITFPLRKFFLSLAVPLSALLGGASAAEQTATLLALLLRNLHAAVAAYVFSTLLLFFLSFRQVIAMHRENTEKIIDKDLNKNRNQ
jgi:hypothetical protein